MTGNSMINRKAPIILGLVIVIFLVVFLYYSSQTFHLIKTEPRNGSQPNQYTSVVFEFNQSIQSGSGLNQITITPEISGKTSVTAKSVVFIPNGSYIVGTRYTVVLSGAMSIKGKLLKNLKIEFTPQFVDYSKLPKDIQQRLISQTDINDKLAPYSAAVIAIQGSSALINHGVTSQQLNNLKLAFFNFFQSKHLEVRGLVLSNVVKSPHDPNSATTVDTISFIVTLDNKTIYNGRIDYSNLSTIRLYLYDNNNGALVYDSGNINQ